MVTPRHSDMLNVQDVCLQGMATTSIGRRMAMHLAQKRVKVRRRVYFEDKRHGWRDVEFRIVNIGQVGAPNEPVDLEMNSWRTLNVISVMKGVLWW